VAVTVTATGIDLEIDEGQIERVLYLGQLSFQQIRFKLALALPNDVFNRPLLDAQVRELSRSMGLTGVRWELIRTSAVAHVGPQVTQLPPQMDLALMGSTLIHERRPYEVHIIFPEVLGTGLGLEVRSGYLNGFEGGLLCSMVPFANASGQRFGLTYLYKQGTFYPFAPSGERSRDTLLELSVRDLLGEELPMEPDLQRWLAVWKAPGL